MAGQEETRKRKREIIDLTESSSLESDDDVTIMLVEKDIPCIDLSIDKD